MTSTCVVSLLLALTTPSPGWAVSPEDLAELVALEDRPITNLSSPEISWSANGAHLMVSGLAADRRPTVIMAPIDGRPPFAVPGLAASQIAFGPGGLQLAGWLTDPTIPGHYRLASFDIITGAGTSLAGVPPFPSASPVTWLPDPQRIIALRPQGDYTALVIFDPATGSLAPLVVTVAGTGTMLRQASRPSSVVVGTTSIDGTVNHFLVDINTGIAMTCPEDEPSLADAGTGSAGVSPDGSLVALCRPEGIWVGTPEKPEARQLLPRDHLGEHDFMSATQPVWSPTGEHLAYTVSQPGATLTQVRLISLGLEEIVCEIAYPLGAAPPQLGAKAWVCIELERDAAGNVVEPKWATLKAELGVISSPLPEANGTLVRARSVGLGTGVLRRLTGVTDPPANAPNESQLTIGVAGGIKQQVLRSFTLPARQGLIAWSEGASLGQVMRVKVTRRALILIGAPVPD
ncbi:MAG TPA: hypothetical protein QGH10_13490 [Armatimonadota bacterium]|nr:hypothetical protein [Armatimonadota bacterium]